MAILFTDTGAAQADATLIADGFDVSGGVTLARGVFTVPAGVAVGDVIKVALIPGDARVVPELSSVRTEVLGTTFTLKVGTEDKPDAFAVNVGLQTAGIARFAGGTDVVCERLARKCWVVATVTAVTGAVAGRKAVLQVAYTL